MNEKNLRVSDPHIPVSVLAYSLLIHRQGVCESLPNHLVLLVKQGTKNYSIPRKAQMMM